MSSLASDEKPTQPGIGQLGYPLCSPALLPGRGGSSGRHSDLHSCWFSHRKKAWDYWHLCLLLALLMDSVIHHFPVRKNSNCLRISNSSSLRGLQTLRLHFRWSMIVTTYLLASFSPIAPPLTLFLLRSAIVSVLPEKIGLVYSYFLLFLIWSWSI